MGHVIIGIVFLFIGSSQRCLYNIQYILEINEKATLNINMPYSENRLLKIAARDKAVLYFSLWPGVV